MGTHRLHRLRRSARRTSRCSATCASSGRRWLSAERLRGRDRGVQPAARPGVDAARDLLGVAGRGRRRRDRRRRRVHRSRAGRHPRPRRVVPRGLTAELGARRGSGGRRRGRRSRRPRRDRTRPAELGSACASRAGDGCCTQRSAASRPRRVGPWLVLVLLGLRLHEIAIGDTSGAIDATRASTWPVRSPQPRIPRRAASSPWRGSRSRSARCPTAAGS